MRIFYFGPWDGPGHYVWTPTARQLWPERLGPWVPREFDATPYDRRAWYYGKRVVDTKEGLVPADPEEKQGVWRLTVRDGWTALGAWDRSCDRRGGSKAVFIAEGMFTEDEMKAGAAEHFPAVWARIAGSLAAEQT